MSIVDPPVSVRRTTQTENAEEMQDSVRVSWLILPEGIQPFLTALSGKPYPGQQPTWRWTSAQHIVLTLIGLCLSVTVTAFLIVALPLTTPLWIVSMILTAGAARKAQVTLIHHASHDTLCAIKSLNRVAAEILSSLLVIQDYVGYKTDHLHHHSALGSLEQSPNGELTGDADLLFLWELGFRPGISKPALWRKLIWTLISPRFHYLFLRARFRANFVKPRWQRKALALAVQAGILTLVAVTHTWLPFLLAWVFPLTVLYHISALLQFLSEHLWYLHPDSSLPPKARLAKMTKSRLSGEAAPNSPLRKAPKAWAIWWFRMIFVHGFFRVFVIVGDLPQHDWHHRHLRGDWPNATYERQRDLDAGCPGWPELYTEVWSLKNAIDAVFDVMSSLSSAFADEYRADVGMTDADKDAFVGM